MNYRELQALLKDLRDNYGYESLITISLNSPKIELESELDYLLNMNQVCPVERSTCYGGKFIHFSNAYYPELFLCDITLNEPVEIVETVQNQDFVVKTFPLAITTLFLKSKIILNEYVSINAPSHDDTWEYRTAISLLRFIECNLKIAWRKSALKLWIEIYKDNCASYYKALYAQQKTKKVENVLAPYFIRQMDDCYTPYLQTTKDCIQKALTA